VTDRETPHTAAADADQRQATREQPEQRAETHEKVANKDVLLTPDGQELDLGITGTMHLDPPGHLSNPHRLASIKYALAGLLYVLTHEQSIQWATTVTLIVLGLGVWLHLSVVSWALLTLALGGVWVTECDRGRRSKRATATLEGGRLHTLLFDYMQRVYALTPHCTIDRRP